MKTHEQIDKRSLAMARMIVSRIDADPGRAGLAKARATCRRWAERSPSKANHEWLRLLEGTWEQIRTILVEESERGNRLRQNDPFCGILSAQERWAIYKAHREAQ